MAPHKGGFYAVRNGRIPGVYSTWAECETQIKGFPDAKYKKFAKLDDAESFISGSPADPADLVVSSNPVSSDVKGKKRAFGPEVADTTGWDIVYSDGACKGNGKVGSIAGVGVWWGAGDPRNIAERCPGDQTNNRAELIAILRVLETTPLGKKPLLIRTDSQYSIQCFRDWITRWQRNEWRNSAGGDVKNAGIIRCVSKQLSIRAKSGQRVLLEYVKGHSGEVGNDGADALANVGTLLPVAPERDWDTIEKHLDEQLSKTISSGEVSKVTSLSAQDDKQVPTKLRKVSDVKGSFSTSKLVALHSSSLNKSPVISPKREYRSLSSASNNNLSKPPGNKSGHSPPLHSIQQSMNDLRKSPQKPIIPIPMQDVNLNDYEDCLLDDDDLANEVFD